MKALVIGYGRSGKAAETLLRAEGAEVRVLRDEKRDRIDCDFDMAVVSPGIALTHPWIVEAKRRGIPLKSELQLGCEALRRRGWRLLAVTGSKGKSSVVKIVADAIASAGGEAVACGNYGVPVCEVANRADADAASGASRPDTPWAVVEVSSFMMETTELPPDAFEAAAILNLQEDHLDRHGSVAVYHGLKRKLLTMAKTPLDYSGERTWSDLVKHGLDGGDELWGCSYYAGSYFDNEILIVNGAAAASLMEVAGVDGMTIRRAFRDFVPLPHRMNLVAERDGVRYVDDSKATSLAALAAGVRMVPGNGANVRLVAGGLAKGDDPKSVLAILTRRVKKVYLIGRCADVFFAAWGAAVDCEVCGTMDRAVGSARRDAARGETVLLSPGTASFDQFNSFEERGDVFARLVNKEGQKRNE